MDCLFKKFIICILGIALLAGSAYAQQAENIPEEALNQLITDLESVTSIDENEEIFPFYEPKIEIEQEKRPTQPPINSPTFKLNKITIEGNQAIPTSELEPFMDPLVDNDVTFEDVRKASEMITNHYRSKGYVTSRAFIPPQRVKNGEVTVKIFEGKFGEVIVEGNKYYKKFTYVDVLDIKKDEILKYQRLEQALFKINQDSFRKAKAFLIAGLNPGTSDVVLQVKEKFPISAYYEFNNRGTKFTHRARHNLSLTHYSLLGLGDTARINIPMAEQRATQGFSGTYAFPIPGTNTTLNLNGSFARSKLTRELRAFNVTGKSFELGVSVRHRFYESLKIQIDGEAGFQYRDSKSILDGLKLSYDRTRRLHAGPRVTLRDKHGRTNISGEVRVGIPNVLGGSKSVDPNASRFRSGGRFLYYTGSIQRVQRMPLSTFIVTRLTAQWSHHNLPSIEQFRAGGVFSVRGYPESDFNGDYGLQWTAEWRTPLPLISENILIPRTGKPLKRAVQLFGFIDGAKAYLRERANPSTVKSKLLMGAGFGVSANITRSISADLSYGIPFGEASSDNDRNYVHLTARGGF